MDNKALDLANELVYSERAAQYGSFQENAKKLSDLYYALSGVKLDEKQVALFLVALKLAREGTKHKRDNVVDAMGYLELYDQLWGGK